MDVVERDFEEVEVVNSFDFVFSGGKVGLGVWSWVERGGDSDGGGHGSWMSRLGRLGSGFRGIGGGKLV